MAASLLAWSPLELVGGGKLELTDEDVVPESMASSSQLCSQAGGGGAGGCGQRSLGGPPLPPCLPCAG